MHCYKYDILELDITRLVLFELGRGLHHSKINLTLLNIARWSFFELCTESIFLQCQFIKIKIKNIQNILNKSTFFLREIMSKIVSEIKILKRPQCRPE